VSPGQQKRKLRNPLGDERHVGTETGCAHEAPGLKAKATGDAEGFLHLPENKGSRRATFHPRKNVMAKTAAKYFDKQSGFPVRPGAKSVPVCEWQEEVRMCK